MSRTSALTFAIQATVDRHETPLSTTTPVVLTVVFAEDQAKKSQWSSFVRKADVDDAGSLAKIIAAVARHATGGCALGYTTRARADTGSSVSKFPAHTVFVTDFLVL